ncbi:MAG: reverse transcriptase family protein, partial [Gemmatimonadaceae bacterium]
MHHSLDVLPRIPETVDDVCQALGMGSDQLAKLSRLIRLHGYDPFVLLAGKKRRTIHKPRKWLKTLQRSLHDHVLSAFPISDAVYSQRGRSVIANASQHLARTHLIVMDIQACFPSARVQMVRDALRRAGIAEPVVGLITRLVTYQDMLPQGPPSSPAVLNLVFTRTDFALTELAERHDATYTRYMDDICFSANHAMLGLRREADRTVRNGGFRLNMEKFRSWGPSDPHTITKIVVTSTLNPEPAYLLLRPSNSRYQAAYL